VGQILLIEDNLANAEMMIRLLETCGYEVKHFDHGLPGARWALQNRPSVILLDFNLPDVDGRTLLLMLKQRIGTVAAPPIIAVTARTGVMEEAIAERFGCDAFVRKPFEPQEFLDIVATFAGEPTKTS
jgi:CheY-like chemotaxis protein